MKYVVAILEPHFLDPVRQGLDEIGIVAMTVSEVGGSQPDQVQDAARDAPTIEPDKAMVRLEVAIPDVLESRAVEVIREMAEMHSVKSGKIFQLTLEDVVRIRTGETGEVALGQSVSTNEL